MKIIILGAGQVGGTLAENLVGENNDITLVDTNGDRLRSLQDKFDLRVVQGTVLIPAYCARQEPMMPICWWRSPVRMKPTWWPVRSPIHYSIRQTV